MIPERLAAALADRYRLERELGQGGMAVVYLAEDLKHRRRVAIKVLKPELAQIVGADRFLREIEIAAGLTHPHVLPLHDSGEAGGFLYYVMPYIEGESLRARMAREGELPVAEALRILRDVVDALTHAHERGVVHRDIKPDNVLLGDRHALVTDFGVAKAVSEASEQGALTQTGMAVGTPAYMAPEQAVADPHVDHRADLYAVGVLAYEMLTGRPPFAATTPQALLAAHVTEVPEPVRQHRETVPEPVAEAVMRCLAKKPADRWQTARELLARIEGAITPGTGTTPAAPRHVQSRSRGRRSVGIAAAAGVVAIVLAAFFVRGNDTMVASVRRIAVVPFAPASPDTALARLGRDLVVTVSAGLDGVGEVTTVDGSTMLARTQGRSDAYTLREAVELGEALGSASVLHGNLLRSGDSVRLEATLVATADEAVLARLSVTGAPEDVGAFTDSLNWALLREIWPGDRLPTRSIQGLSTRSLPALRAFLEGEHAAVDDRWEDAAAAYGRAIEADSTFWMAYLRYGRARGWYGAPVDEVVWDRLLEHLVELPPRERALLEAGDVDNLRARLDALEAVIARFPDYWFAWFEYADRLVHVAPLVGYTRADAQAALERTLSLNPQFVSAWDHLFWVTVGREPAVAQEALEVLDRLDRGPARGLRRASLYRIAAHIDSLPAAAARPVADSAARALLRLLPDLPPVDAAIALGDPVRLNLPRAQIRISRAIRAMTTSARDALVVHAWFGATAWMMRGGWDSALVQVDFAAAQAPSVDAGLEQYAAAVLGAWLGAVDPAEARARRRAAREALSRGTADRPAPRGPTLRVTEAREALPSDREAYAHWLDGVLAAAEGDTAALRTAAAAIGRSDVPDVALLQRSLAGLAQGLEGDRAAGAATLAAVEADRAAQSRGDLRARAEAYRYPYLHEVNRLQAGRWFLAAGDTAGAARVLMWHENLNVPSPVAGIAYLERARIAEGRGQPALARGYYEQFLRLYDRPPDAHRHLVREAEEALARLTGVREVGS